MWSTVSIIAVLCPCVGAQFLLAGLLKNGDSAPISHSTGTTKNSGPAICHGLDCPEFSVIETNDKFEVRRYEASQWVATKRAVMLYSNDVRHEMFEKLFHYIAGNNSAHMKIAMTAPVVTEIEHGQGPDCESNFTMHFMIPFALQRQPPLPTEQGVYIRNVPAMTVIVKSYGGFSNDDLKRQNLEQLIKDLDAANKVYEDRKFFTAGYDGPYTFTDRHNELWVLSK